LTGNQCTEKIKFDDINTPSFKSAKESIKASPSKKAVEEERFKYELAMDEARSLEEEENARHAELEEKEKARHIAAAEEETRLLLKESGSFASRTKE
jgi:PP-loop superfamily ATP-utilizing enzyme